MNYNLASNYFASKWKKHVPIRVMIRVFMLIAFIIVGCTPDLSTEDTPVQVIVVSTAGTTRASEGLQPYSLGIFPYLSATLVETAISPLVAELNKAVTRDFRFRMRPNFEAYRDALLVDTFDIALVQPFDYVEAAAPAGYLPIARIPEPLTAIFVVIEKLLAMHLTEAGREALETARFVGGFVAVTDDDYDIVRQQIALAGDDD